MVSILVAFMELRGPCHSTEQIIEHFQWVRISITAFVASYLKSVTRSGMIACSVNGDLQYACSVFLSGEVGERI
jgi:hypothetical protein